MRLEDWLIDRKEAMYLLKMRGDSMKDAGILDGDALLYQATGVILMNLESQDLQPDLFGGHAEIECLEKIYTSVDSLSRKYGKHTVFLGSSFKAMRGSRHLTERGDQARRKTQLPRRERLFVPHSRHC